MSASDAAPLPRLGEVFFDVRGNSRSMRLSWYADTQVAVLSIWQGGMCTGTFRLAIADLPRMVETLQRGPGGQQGWDGEAQGRAFAGDATAQAQTMAPMSGQMMPPDAADLQNGAGALPDPLSGPVPYPADAQPPGRRSGGPGYLADPLEALGQLGVPQTPRPAPAPYQSGTHDYLTGPPPAEQPRPTEYLTAPPGYPTAPPQQAPQYLADLPPAPGADRAGYGAGLHTASSPGGYPGAGDSGAYPPGTGRQGAYPGEPTSDRYPAGTGPMDFQGDAPVSHYPDGTPAARSGSSSSSQGDALNPTTADYPVHYGAALTDDMADELPLESFPYQQRRGGR